MSVSYTHLDVYKRQVMDPTLVPGKMLLSGEYSKLMKEISELSGFNDIEEELKN